MRRWWVIVAALALGGCSSLPDPGKVALSAPMPLPARARVLIDISQSDLDRKFSYDLNTVTRQQTDIKEGAALEQAAAGLLGQAFLATGLNQAAPRPDVVAHISGTEEFDHVADTFHVKCGIDAARADGIPLGHFYGAYKSPPVLSIEASLPRVYALCLKGPVEAMLRSAEWTRFAAAGFPPLDTAAVDGYLRSQGYVIR